MTKPGPAEFKWRQFEPRVILMAVGWYLRFSLSYRDVEELVRGRGLSVDHVTVWRWPLNGLALRTGRWAAKRLWISSTPTLARAWWKTSWAALPMASTASAVLENMSSPLCRRGRDRRGCSAVWWTMEQPRSAHGLRVNFAVARRG